MWKRVLIAVATLPVFGSALSGIAAASAAYSSSTSLYNYAYSSAIANNVAQGVEWAVNGPSGTPTNTGATMQYPQQSQNATTPSTTQPSPYQNNTTSGQNNASGNTMAPNTTNTNGVYAALGDSVAAGLGLATNASSSDNAGCGQSSQGYPNIVAQQRNLQLINATCSGAVVSDLYEAHNVNGTQMPAQLDTAFSQGTPQLITITVGANDLHWAQFLQLCQSFTCNTGINSTVARGYMTVLRGKLTYALQDIQRRSNGQPPQVIVTGYYNPISNACKGQLSGFTNDEIGWLNDQRTALNNSIQSVVAHYPFATYATTDFSGHSACSTDPWVQGLSSGTAALHPTATGQQQIAQSVLAGIR